VPASAVLAAWLSLPRGYWVPFSVAVILKPDYSTLFGRGLGRLVGTLLGATLAAVLISELHPGPLVTTVLVGLAAWAAYATWTASFSVAIGFVTALVLIVLSVSLHDAVGTAVDRFVDVSLGGAIAVFAYVIWPTSPRAGVAEAQCALFGSLRQYLAMVGAVVTAQPTEPSRITACSRATRLAWARAEAAVGRSINEPATTRIDPSQGRGLLAAALRILRAAHALRIEAGRGATVVPFAELTSLFDGLDQALAVLADHLAERTPGPVPDLRALHGTLERRRASGGAPPSIGLHLDELVNAVNTAAQLSGLPAASRHG